MTTDQYATRSAANDRGDADTDPDAVRREIDTTRAELSRDVDALTDKVSPTRVVGRRVEKVRGAATSARSRVMGSGAASSMSGSTASAVDSTRRSTEGNPLAAGLIAFGVGWLVSSLVPATEKERAAASTVEEKAREHSDTIAEPMKEAVGQVTDNLSASAKDAADAVKEKAGAAASEVAQQAKPS